MKFATRHSTQKVSSKHTKTNTCRKEVVVAVAVAGSSASARIRSQHFNVVSNLWLIFYTGRLIRMV
jgi:hypothetical protein